VIIYKIGNVLTFACGCLCLVFAYVYAEVWPWNLAIAWVGGVASTEAYFKIAGDNDYDD